MYFSRKKILVYGIAPLAAAFFLFAGVKAYLWSPFFPIVEIVGVKSMVKLGLTVLLEPPFRLSNGDLALKKIGNAVMIVDSQDSEGIKALFEKFPPPAEVTSPASGWRTRVETLRTFVSNVLPDKSSLPHKPEPIRALELLGNNASGEKYPKLCSKNSKIFVQYLTGLGIPSRMVQLKDHVTVEVWNESAKKWEIQDLHFDSSVIADGRRLSASEAFERLDGGGHFDYKGREEFFRTVVYITRTNFSNDHLKKWHYFNYDNLAYWKVLKVSGKSWKLWADR